MPFRIQNRVPRGQPNTVGLRMNQHREHLAKAIEAASLVTWTGFRATNISNGSVVIGVTPAVGCKAANVYVHIGTQGTGANTVDVTVDGTSILTAPLDIDVDTNTAAISGAVLSATLTTAAQEALAAGKVIKMVIVGVTNGAADITVDFQAKVVHNATGN